MRGLFAFEESSIGQETAIATKHDGYGSDWQAQSPLSIFHDQQNPWGISLKPILFSTLMIRHFEMGGTEKV